MEKKTKKVLMYVMIAVLVLGCVGVLIVFNVHEKYEEYSLEEAYENGYITQEQLKSIAYYYNKENGDNKENGETEEHDFKPLPKARLNIITENNIKWTYLQRFKREFPHANIGRVYLTYYGIYNGYAVVEMGNNLYPCGDPRVEKEKIIGGVSFYQYTPLSVYKIKG